MSIKIDAKKCIRCSKCINVCPGNLLYRGEDGRAYIKYPSECWGCTACLKECDTGAVKYYLGADIGGNGAVLYVRKEGYFLHWYIEKTNGETEIITVNKNESNKY